MKPPRIAVSRRALLLTSGGTLLASGTGLLLRSLPIGGAAAATPQAPLGVDPGITLRPASGSEPVMPGGSRAAVAIPNPPATVVAPAITAGPAAPPPSATTPGPGVDGSEIRPAIASAPSPTAAPDPDPDPTAPVAGPSTAAPPPAALPATDRIRIPTLDVDAPVVVVGQDALGRVGAPANAVGVYSFGADAGDFGNAVFTAHNDIDGAIFARLGDIEIGAGIIFSRGGLQFVYRVDFITGVWEEGAPTAMRRANTRYLLPTANPIATLISCYPAWIDTHRWIVRASLSAAGSVRAPTFARE